MASKPECRNPMSAFQQIELIKLFEFCWVVPGADSTYVDDVKIIFTFKVIFLVGIIANEII